MPKRMKRAANVAAEDPEVRGVISHFDEETSRNPDDWVPEGYARLVDELCQAHGTYNETYDAYGNPVDPRKIVWGKVSQSYRQRLSDVDRLSFTTFSKSVRSLFSASSAASPDGWALHLDEALYRCWESIESAYDAYWTGKVGSMAKVLGREGRESFNDLRKKLKDSILGLLPNGPQ